MNTQESRDAFENWMKAENPHIGVGKREGDGYWQYSANLMWQAWQASYSVQRDVEEGRPTVQEAFALAEHPVPEGAKLYKRNGTWMYDTPGGDHFYFDCFNRWLCASKNSDAYRGQILVNRLPAADCLDALPECVRAALLPTELREEKSDV